MATQADIRRFRQNLRKEKDAALLYARMAASEQDPNLAALYHRLAETEQRHVDVWDGKLREAGVTPPPHRRSWQGRALGWLAGRFGARVVLPSIAAIEQDAVGEYDGQPEAKALGMPAEERSHARIFRLLARIGPGMEGSAVARVEGRHRSTGGNALRAGVLGANDGLVSVLSLVMGVAGAEMSRHAILITGLAGTLAGAISMALGEWLSVQSSRELHSHQLSIEKDELATAPGEELEELALIYQAKGLPAEDARRMATRLLSDPRTALDTLSREELGFDPSELGGSAWEAAITSFLLFAGGALAPVLPFVFVGGLPGVLWSCGLSCVGLFAVGAGITLVTGRSLWWSGTRQVVFGMTAAAVTFGLGHMLGVNIAG